MPFATPFLDVLWAVDHEAIAAAVAAASQDKGINWGTIIIAIAGALAPVGAALGVAGKVFLAWLSEQSEKQRSHAAEMAARVEKIADKFDLSVRDSRAETQRTTEALLSINRDTVEAVGELAGEVKELGLAIGELRAEVSHKQDRPDRPAGPHPRGPK